MGHKDRVQEDAALSVGKCMGMKTIHQKTQRQVFISTSSENFSVVRPEYQKEPMATLEKSKDKWKLDEFAGYKTKSKSIKSKT